MTVSSGRKCCALLPKRGPIGWLLKMLLVSLNWHSKACVLTWKPKTMKSGRLLFQLAPSVRRTEGIESGLSATPKYAEALLRTPQAGDAEHGGPNSRDSAGSPHLTAQIAGLLPTPPPTSPRPHDNDNTAGAFYPSQNQQDLTGIIAAMLPTPTQRDYKDTGNLENVPENAIGKNPGPKLRLEPAFSLWMMGYPEDWLEDGE